jgi:uncharacterized Zn ribbon protein
MDKMGRILEDLRVGKGNVNEKGDIHEASSKNKVNIKDSDGNLISIGDIVFEKSLNKGKGGYLEIKSITPTGLKYTVSNSKRGVKDNNDVQSSSIEEFSKLISNSLIILYNHQKGTYMGKEFGYEEKSTYESSGNIEFKVGDIIKILKDFKYKRISVGTAWKIISYDRGVGDYEMIKVNPNTGKETSDKKPWFQGSGYLEKWLKEGIIEVVT